MSYKHLTAKNLSDAVNKRNNNLAEDAEIARYYFTHTHFMNTNNDPKSASFNYIYTIKPHDDQYTINKKIRQL